jgi:hypothetical protein
MGILIQLAIVNHENRHFNFQNRNPDANVVRVQVKIRISRVKIIMYIFLPIMCYVKPRMPCLYF